MRMGKVIGRIWATVKDTRLTGVQLSIVQPVDENQAPVGRPLVAADIINSTDGSLVYWVTGAEATFPLPDRQIPSDISIVGYVERLDL